MSLAPPLSPAWVTHVPDHRSLSLQRSCLLITLHYIDQICTRLPKFTITSLTIHRFIIASITVSSKALCDVFCTNTHYAKVGGITVAELNMLEKEFLGVIDWRLFVSLPPHGGH